MNREQVIDAVRHIMYNARADEARRLDQINEAMKPWTYEQAVHLLESQGRSDEPVVGMKWRSQTNMLPLVVGTYSQAMKIDNYLASGTKDTAQVPWEWWQRNKMDARQTGLIRGVLKYGAAFTTVLPSLTPAAARRGPEQPGAFIRCLSPRQMTCMYGEPIEWTPGETPVDDDWPIMALEIKGSSIRFYDEDKVHFLGAKLVPESALGWSEAIYQHPDNFEYIEGRSHGVGVCPVVRFRDRWDMDGEEQYGIVEPLLSVQSRINETEYNKAAAEYFTAFIQRWVAGWRPQDETQALQMAAGDVWYFNKADVKVGQFEQGDLKAYLDSGQAGRMDLAAIAQLPPHALGLSQLVNISEATLAALETGKKRNTSEIQTSLGESFEQMFRTCAHLVGDTSAAEDFQSEAKWADLTARTLAETIDALGKMSAMLDIPDEILYEDIPGKTKAWVDRVIAKKKELQEELARQMAAGEIPAGGTRPPEENEDEPVEAGLNGERTPVPFSA
jgi:DNA-binding XRE family transcriptional regulator